jgi:hypothetical protein
MSTLLLAAFNVMAMPASFPNALHLFSWIFLLIPRVEQFLKNANYRLDIAADT